VEYWFLEQWYDESKKSGNKSHNIGIFSGVKAGNSKQSTILGTFINLVLALLMFKTK